MNYLIVAANELGLQNIAEQTGEMQQVHGIVVELDPFWLRLYKMYLTSSAATAELRRYYRAYRELGYYYGWPFLSAEWNGKTYFPTVTPLDLQWYPDIWKEDDNRSNLIVRILLRPGSRPVEIGYQGVLQVIQDHQPVPRMAVHGIPQFRPLEGGVSLGCGMNSPGTLGGILFDNGGKQYAVTCSHVIGGTDVDQPAKFDHASAATIGKLALRGAPTALPAGLKCNAYVKGANEMDLALIELDGSVTGTAQIHKIGKIDGFMPNIDLAPDLQVEFHGRTSGYKNSIVIVGTGLVNEIEDEDGNVYCFKNLMIVADPSITSLVMSRPVKGGDSGAWIMGQGRSGTEWCGMIIGENRLMGFGITAETILEFLKAKGLNLRCS